MAARRGFADDTELAEIATLGVCVNLQVGEPLLAAALQPVAATAWARLAGDAAPDDLLREARRARRELRMAAGAVTERRFLDSVIRHARHQRRGDRVTRST